MNAALLIVIGLGTIGILLTIWKKYSDYNKFSLRRHVFDNSLIGHRYFIRRYSTALRAKDLSEKVRTRIIFSDNDLHDESRVFAVYQRIISERLKDEFPPRYFHVDIKAPHGFAKTGLVDEAIQIYFNTKDTSRHAFTEFSAAGLISSVLQYLISSTDKASFDNTTVVGMLVGNKVQKDNRAYLFLGASALAQILFGLLSPEHFSVAAFAVTGIFIGAITLNQRALEYRIRSGLYGTTAYEAREIAQFVSEHSDKSDFTSGGRVKTIVPDPEEVPQEILIFGGAIAR